VDNMYDHLELLLALIAGIPLTIMWLRDRRTT
jgi:hypothetical protein